jgi:hypothetical protein
LCRDLALKRFDGNIEHRQLLLSETERHLESVRRRKRHDDGPWIGGLFDAYFVRRIDKTQALVLVGGPQCSLIPLLSVLFASHHLGGNRPPFSTVLAFVLIVPAARHARQTRADCNVACPTGPWPGGDRNSVQ